MTIRCLSILISTFAAAVAAANAQSHGYTLPSDEEQFGKGIRKVVMIRDNVRRTARIARDGSIVKPFWTLPKPEVAAHASVSNITRRNRETLTDSIFWTRDGEVELTDVLFYRDSTFNELAKTINGCREGVLQQTSYNLSTSDTTIWLTVDETDKYKPKPYFHIYKKYKGGEVDLDYSPDSLLISSFRIVRDSRGMVDTIYDWRRYGPPSGCYHRGTRLPQRRTLLHNPLPPQILAILKAIAKTNCVTFHTKTSRNIGTSSENQTNTSTPSAIARKMSTNSRGRLSLPPVSCRKRMKQHRGNVTKLVTISTMTGVIELKKPVSKNISEQTNPNETKAMPIGTARHLIRNSETLIILMI